MEKQVCNKCGKECALGPDVTTIFRGAVLHYHEDCFFADAPAVRAETDKELARQEEFAKAKAAKLRDENRVEFEAARDKRSESEIEADEKKEARRVASRRRGSNRKTPESDSDSGTRQGKSRGAGRSAAKGR